MECGAQIELGSMQSCMSRVTPGPALRSGGKPPPSASTGAQCPPPCSPILWEGFQASPVTNTPSNTNILFCLKGIK